MTLTALATAAFGEGDPGFVRGIGWSPWHAVHGWGRPPDVVAQDYDILQDPKKDERCRPQARAGTESAIGQPGKG